MPCSEDLGQLGFRAPLVPPLTALTARTYATLTWLLNPMIFNNDPSLNDTSLLGPRVEGDATSVTEPRPGPVIDNGALRQDDNGALRQDRAVKPSNPFPCYSSRVVTVGVSLSWQMTS